MKNLSVFVLFIICSLTGFAQKNAGAFLSFVGEGNCTSGNSTKTLIFPMLFNGGDKIKLTKGTANLILANGKEVSVSISAEYEIPQMKKEEMIVELDASVFQDYNVQSQSNSTIAVRSSGSKSESVNLMLFPISSKVIDKSKARILWKINSSSKITPTIKFSDVITLDEVYKLKGLSTNEIYLKDIPLKEGTQYTWAFITFVTNSEQNGIIELLSEKEKSALPHFTYGSKSEYIKAITYFIKNEFYFDAFNVIEEAIKKYPETDLFTYLRKKISGE